MLDFGLTFYAIGVLGLLSLAFVIAKLRQQQNRICLQDMRIAQMYLDKQFCVRLLNLILSNYEDDDLPELLTQEVKAYYDFNDMAILGAEECTLLVKKNSIRERAAKIIMDNLQVIKKRLSINPWTTMNGEDALYKYGITQIGNRYVCFIMNKRYSLNSLEQDSLTMEVPRLVLLAHQRFLQTHP